MPGSYFNYVKLYIIIYFNAFNFFFWFLITSSNHPICSMYIITDQCKFEEDISEDENTDSASKMKELNCVVVINLAHDLMKRLLFMKCDENYVYSVAL